MCLTKTVAKMKANRQKTTGYYIREYFKEYTTPCSMDLDSFMSDFMEFCARQGVNNAAVTSRYAIVAELSKIGISCLKNKKGESLKIQLAIKN